MMLYFLIFSVSQANEFITKSLGTPAILTTVCQNLYISAQRTTLIVFTNFVSAVSLPIYFQSFLYFSQSLSGKFTLKYLLYLYGSSLNAKNFFLSKNFINSQSHQSSVILESIDISL